MVVVYYSNPGSWRHNILEISRLEQRTAMSFPPTIWPAPGFGSRLRCLQWFINKWLWYTIVIPMAVYIIFEKYLDWNKGLSCLSRQQSGLHLCGYQVSFFSFFFSKLDLFRISRFYLALSGRIVGLYRIIIFNIPFPIRDITYDLS